MYNRVGNITYVVLNQNKIRLTGAFGVNGGDYVMVSYSRLGNNDARFNYWGFTAAYGTLVYVAPASYNTRGSVYETGDILMQATGTSIEINFVVDSLTVDDNISMFLEVIAFRSSTYLS